MRSDKHKYTLDADSLRYAARKAGFTGGRFIRDLSDASGVDYKILKTYMNGTAKQPNASFIMQLAETLDCEPWDLMRER